MYCFTCYLDENYEFVILTDINTEQSFRLHRTHKLSFSKNMSLCQVFYVNDVLFPEKASIGINRIWMFDFKYWYRDWFQIMCIGASLYFLLYENQFLALHMVHYQKLVQ